MTAKRRNPDEHSPANEARGNARVWQSPWSLDDEWQNEPRQESHIRDVEPSTPSSRPPTVPVFPSPASSQPPVVRPSGAATEPSVRVANAPPRPHAHAPAGTVAQPVVRKAPPPPSAPEIHEPRPAAKNPPAPTPVPAQSQAPISTPAPTLPAKQPPVVAPAPEPAKPAPASAPPAVSDTLQVPAASPASAPAQTKPAKKAPPVGVIGPKRFSWASPIILSLGLLGLTFLVWVYWQDVPAETDEDLRLSTPVDQARLVLAPRRLRSFLDSVAPLDDPSLARVPASQWNTPSLGRVIGLNGAAYDNLRDLLEDGDWHPRHSSWFMSDLGDHESWPQAPILLQAQAAYLVRRGDEENAFTTAIDLAEFSRRLQELWAWPSYASRSTELHAACVQTLAELLKKTRLDSDRLGSFQKEFADCEPSRQMLLDALSAYYIHEKKLLLGAESGELLDTMPQGVRQRRAGRLFFKMNETLNLFAGAFRELKTEVSAPPSVAFGAAGERVRHTRQTSPQFYQPNATGERYFSDRIDPYLDLPEKHNLAVARHQLVTCLFAIRRYVADHQRLPAGLSDLRPKYLAEIPKDPFSGEALHYDPLRGLLFSVGTNFVSEGGKPTVPPLDDPREPTIELGIVAATVVK